MFICLEGYDGIGKSTQLEYLKEYFEKKGNRVLITRRDSMALYNDVLEFIEQHP